MTGTLGLFSLADLFQLLAGSGRSGRLTIDRPEGSARIFFEAGQAVHAEFGELSGEEAVYALFVEEHGSFEFVLGVPAPQATIDVSAETLVLEAMRRVDEAKRHASDSIDGETVLAYADADGKSASLRLDAQQVALLRHVDGRRSVDELARAAGLRGDQILGVVNRLLTMGVVKTAGRRPRTARLVARLARRHGLAQGSVGLDPKILSAWSRATGNRVAFVLCRRPDGHTVRLRAVPIEEAGPYLVASRETLMVANLTVDQALLVRPVQEGSQ